MAFQTRVAMLAPNAGFQCPQAQLVVGYGIRCVARKAGFDFNHRESAPNRFLKSLRLQPFVARRNSESFYGRIIAHQTFIEVAIVL
jgi:hypothetical protein